MNIQQSVWREEVNAAKIKAEFRVEHVLGNGAFATVFKASYLHGNHNLPNNSNAVALKIINLKRVANRRRNRRSKGSITACSVHSFSKELETDELFISSSRKRKRGGHDRKKNGALLLSVKEMVAREISVHREASKANHPNIVALLDSFYYDLPRRTNVAALVMELCPEDLGSYLRRKKNERKHEAHAWKLLPENEVRHALRHVLRGLAFLHSIGIAHRDIKADNILLSPKPNQEKGNNRDFTLINCVLKIGDFGLATKMSNEDDWDNAKNTFCGTPSYLAPEIALRNVKKQSIDVPHDKMHESSGYGLPADLWSTGCLLHAMLFGRYPFSPKTAELMRHDGKHCSEGSRLRKTLRRVVQGRWRIPIGVEVEPHAILLLKQLLSINPRERGFARGLVSTHLFFVASNLCSSVKRPRQTESCSELTKRVRYGRPSTSTIHREKDAQSHCIKPIEGISRLFPGKYQWIELRLSTQFLFTVFLLPSKLGVVMQCERSGATAKGAWMHLLNSGTEICVGKLAPDDVNAATVTLVKEAFHRRPRQDWKSSSQHISHTGTSYASSACTSHLQMNKSEQYKSLSSMLSMKNKPTCLAMYKCLEKFLRSSISQQSNVCMRVNHSNTNTTQCSNKELCSVTTICDDETRYILVSFKDAIQLHYSPTTEVGRLTNLSKSENMIGSIKFCRKLQRLMLLKTNEAGLYSFHLKFAYEAITKLLDLCRDNALKPFERPLIVEARGRSYKDWRLVS